MSTLLLRLAGPMQSWGTQSRFTVRDSGLEPSKSGVIGLLCAALGRRRSEPVDDLAALQMAVRVDREGKVSLDYQTAGGVHRLGQVYGVAKAGEGRPDTVTSRRYYLADADFLVGLEGSDDLLTRIGRALEAPVWPLFLGRKAFPPGVPVLVRDGLRRGASLEAALAAQPWPPEDLAWPPWQLRPSLLRVVVESELGPTAELRHDQPLGAAFLHRRFAFRYVTTRFLRLGADVPLVETKACTSRDSS